MQVSNIHAFPSISNQLDALLAFMKVLKIDFEIEENFSEIKFSNNQWQELENRVNDKNATYISSSESIKRLNELRDNS